MTPRLRHAVLATVAVALAACGGGSDGTDREQTGELSLDAGSGPQLRGETTATVAATAAPVTTSAAAPAPSPPPPASTPITAATTTTPPPTVPPTLPPTTPRPAPAPCQVVYVGDSIGMGILDNGLPDALGAVGCGLGWAGGRRGIEVAAGAAELAEAIEVPANVALVVLGYHNARFETRSGAFDGLIDEVMEAAGPRLVVWPLLGRTPDCSGVYTEAVTDAGVDLQEATARWPNLVLVDYPSLIAAHPEWSENRCPHLLSDGYEGTGEWLAGEVRRIVDARPAG